ncbi:MAG: DUF1080 domain-containing protein [Verrucomicrobia bacterium]|nr:DUF1080 domain-containing protein [Verrucomicrobiota bacterium]
MSIFKYIALTAVTTALTLSSSFAAEEGFTQIFNGKNLDGWKLVGGRGPGYVVQDETIVCPANGGGNLFTEKEYSNFILRFDVKLTPAANNGVGIRAPYEGDAAYMGMEIQVLDNEHKVYEKLQPWQYHGSVYGIFPAKRGFQKAPGEWNTEEIKADGRHITVTLNGTVIVDEDLNTVTNPGTILSHPGMLRDTGHIGFLGHGSEVAFRNIRIKELPYSTKDNVAPEGFKALFNGEDLNGWKGLVSPAGGPPARAKMSAEQLAAEQVKADQQMRDHWKVKDGCLEYDGKGQSLCTAKDYADFEMLVDWKIGPKGDSGIYLRGSPQVQIWDPANFNLGSGGLYNNQKEGNPSGPLTNADNPIGEWNSFRILMIGEKVTVYLNNVLVVNNVTMENYWDRSIPIYPTGQIELQHHNSVLWFKNVYIREINTTK